MTRYGYCYVGMIAAIVCISVSVIVWNLPTAVIGGVFLGLFIGRISK